MKLNRLDRIRTAIVVPGVQFVDPPRDRHYRMLSRLINLMYVAGTVK